MKLSDYNIIGIHGQMMSGKDTVAKIIQCLACNDDDQDWFKSNIEKAITEWDGYFDSLSNWKTKKFAGKLKRVVSIMTGVSVEDLESQEVKNTVLPQQWWFYGFDGGVKIPYLKAKYSDEEKEKYEKYLVKPTLRWMLQYVGTEAFRNQIHPDSWVNALFSDFETEVNVSIGLSPEHPDYLKKEYPSWLITDLRFPNEFKEIKRRGGVTIKIVRDIYSYNGYLLNFDELCGVVFEDTGEMIMKSYADEHYRVKHTHESETALDHIKNWDYVIINNGTLEELIQKIKNIY